MKKIYYFSLTSFALGVICFLSYAAIGSEIAADGTLIEPFGLIPIGFILLTIGLISTFASSFWFLFHKPNKFDKWIFAASLTLIILFVLYFIASISYLSERAQNEISNSKTSSNEIPNSN